MKERETLFDEVENFQEENKSLTESLQKTKKQLALAQFLLHGLESKVSKSWAACYPLTINPISFISVCCGCSVQRMSVLDSFDI